MNEAVIVSAARTAVGKAPLGALRSLFERRTDARSGLPLVQLSIALQKMGDQPRADQALIAGLAASRNTGNGTSDFLGVTVHFTYSWKAGFLAPLGPLRSSVSHYIRLEPQSY